MNDPGTAPPQAATRTAALRCPEDRTDASKAFLEHRSRVIAATARRARSCGLAVSREDIADSYQAAWAAILAGRQRGGHISHPYQYLRTATWHWLLAQADHGARTTPVAEPPEEHVAARAEESLDDLVAARHDRRLLREALLLLPRPQARLYLACYMQGRPRREVAAELGMTMRTIDRHLHAAHQHMRTAAAAIHAGTWCSHHDLLLAARAGRRPIRSPRGARWAARHLSWCPRCRGVHGHDCARTNRRPCVGLP